MCSPGLRQLHEHALCQPTKHVNEDLHMDATAWSCLGETDTCVWEGEAKLFNYAAILKIKDI